MTDQNKIDIDIQNDWTEASKDHGLQIQTPFALHLDKEQGEEFVLLIKDFGSKLGTVVLTDIHKSPSYQLKASGYYISTLGDGYSKYTRNKFVDTLNDWSFFGDIEFKPSWYTGHFWGQEK